MRGANRTGVRPFTGDYAGDPLTRRHSKFGFAQGTYRADPNDGLHLIDCRIANAVRCLPPENKPIPLNSPIADRSCRPSWRMPRLETILALSRGCPRSGLARPHCPGLPVAIPSSMGGCIACPPASRSPTAITARKRYNTNTGGSTTAMFHAVIMLCATPEELIYLPPPGFAGGRTRQSAPLMASVISREPGCTRLGQAPSRLPSLPIRYLWKVPARRRILTGILSDPAEQRVASGPLTFCFEVSGKVTPYMVSQNLAIWELRLLGAEIVGRHTQHHEPL